MMDAGENISEGMDVEVPNDPAPGSGAPTPRVGITELFKFSAASLFSASINTNLDLLQVEALARVKIT